MSIFFLKRLNRAIGQNYRRIISHPNVIEKKMFYGENYRIVKGKYLHEKLSQILFF